MKFKHVTPPPSPLVRGWGSTKVCARMGIEPGDPNYSVQRTTNHVTGLGYHIFSISEVLMHSCFIPRLVGWLFLGLTAL